MDCHAMADCYPDQYFRGRPDLSQRRSTNSAMAQRSPRGHSRYRHVVRGHSIVRLVPKSLRQFSVIYGSLGAGIALLVWMYLLSFVVLVGAEFNAMLFPRTTARFSVLSKVSRSSTAP